MPPHASHCCRALQRQIVSSKDSVWISDSLLAAAFDRYCNVSKTWHRKTSNVPGPLEARRRLGKRNLGDLSGMQYTPSPPAWAFDVPIDLTQWKWEPPQPSSVLVQRTNRPQQNQTNTITLARALDQWLGGLVVDLVEGKPGPPPEPAVSHAVEAPAKKCFFDDVNSFLSEIKNSPAENLIAHANDFSEQLQQAVFLGEVLPKHIESIFYRIWRTMDARFDDHSIASSLCVPLYDAFLTGIATSKVLAPNSLRHKFWTQLLVRMSGLPVNDHLCDLVCKISKSLSTFGPGQIWGLVWKANLLVLEQERISTMRRVRYNWLSLLARLPMLSQDALFEAMAYLSSAHQGTEPLSASEVCPLLISHWAARGHLPSPDIICQKYDEYASGREDTAIASLVMSIHHNFVDGFSREAAYSSVWKLLKKLDRMDDMVKSLKALSHTCQVPRSLVQALCTKCKWDHHVGLRLQKLYTSHLRTTPAAPEWNPAVVGSHAIKIALDPSLPAGTVWSALGIYRIDRLDKSRESHQRIMSRHRGTFGAERAAIVTKLAAVFSDAPHLSNRLAFRQVSRCVRFLEAVQGRVPALVIKALYRVVAKDLIEQRPGRTTRLVWFLNVTRRNYGRGVASSCRRALKAWRYKLAQLKRWREADEREEAEKTESRKKQ